MQTIISTSGTHTIGNPAFSGVRGGSESHHPALAYSAVRAIEHRAAVCAKRCAYLLVFWRESMERDTFDGSAVLEDHRS